MDNKNIIKNEGIKGFYMIETTKRTFISDTKEDIIRSLEKDENSYNVKYIKYVGYYEGKNDVLCIQSSSEESFCTVIDDSTVAYFYETENGKKWKSFHNNNSLSKYYDIFKEKGITLKNDIYTRDKFFRREVGLQLQKLLNAH